MKARTYIIGFLLTLIILALGGRAWLFSRPNLEDWNVEVLDASYCQYERNYFTKDPDDTMYKIFVVVSLENRSRTEQSLSLYRTLHSKDSDSLHMIPAILLNFDDSRANPPNRDDNAHWIGEAPVVIDLYNCEDRIKPILTANSIDFKDKSGVQPGEKATLLLTFDVMKDLVLNIDMLKLRILEYDRTVDPPYLNLKLPLLAETVLDLPEMQFIGAIGDIYDSQQ